MVNQYNDDTTPDDLSFTTDDTDTTESIDTELGDDEATAESKIKSLRVKLQKAEEEKRAIHEELQRTKADFLNARKRLEDDVVLTRTRDTIKHIEKLLPLADSFYLAMLDKTAWEKSDAVWRKGVEGIHRQLEGILAGYNVNAYNPTGEPFNPERHEALRSDTVTDQKQHHTVLSVMQLGYEQKQGNTTVIIRPARVVVGEWHEGEAV